MKRVRNGKRNKGNPGGRLRNKGSILLSSELMEAFIKAFPKETIDGESFR